MKQENDPDQMNRQSDPPEDPELKRLLAEWGAPAPPDELDRRAYASYRAHFDSGGLLRRLLTGWVRIPLPIASAVVLLICATSFLAARKSASVTIEGPPPPPITKYVEVPVPVIREKIVTRVVRREKGLRSSMPNSPISGGIATNAARHDLADFRPVDEINIVVISEEKNHEK